MKPFTGAILVQEGRLFFDRLAPDCVHWGRTYFSSSQCAAHVLRLLLSPWQKRTREWTIRTALGSLGSNACQKHACDGRRGASSFGCKSSPSSFRCIASQGTEYDIFLSFRGTDTRKTFVDILHVCLEDVGLRVFLDDKAIKGGKRINDELIQAIHSSKILMPIFSRNYAASDSCLVELTEMVKCTELPAGPEILAIYVDVTPSDVKLHQGPYIEALHQHRRKFDPETIQQWENVLKEVTEMKGWELEKETNGHQGRFAKFIARKVSEKLEICRLDVTENLVVLNHHVDEVMRLLEVGSGDVRYLVLYGIPGIGKSTLAKFIYNSLLNQFEYCAFLPDIRQNPRQGGLKSLQKRLVSQLLKLNENSPECRVIEGRFSGKKVLILLDDIGKLDQLEALVRKRSWFGSGSRVIITTRYRDILNFSEVDSSYELGGMSNNQSLTLFCKHAFKKDSPSDEDVKYSERAVEISRGHPLALEVIAKFLHNKPKEEWDRSLKMLENVPHDDIQEKFKIILEDLNDQQKQIFLDIAFYFIGVDRRIAIHMWDAQCYPDAAIEELLKCLLIKIQDDNKIWMHDLIRDTGKQMARSSNGEQSRCCNHGEALKLLEQKRGTEAVEGLALGFDSAHPLTPDEFRRVPNLRFLQLNGMKLAGNFKCLLLKLRWLKWHRCPPEVLPKYLDLLSVAVLDLSWSRMSEDWEGWRLFETAMELKVMILKGCSELIRTPDFSAFPALKIVILEHCEALMEFHVSLGHLKHLVSLNLKECTCIEELPEELFYLEALEELIVDGTRIREICVLPSSLQKLQILSARGCTYLTEVHSSIGSLESLLKLVLANTKITELPVSIGSLMKLEVLSLSGCRHISRLPESTGQLKSLVKLNLSDTGITELPTSIGNLQRLKLLRVDGSLLERLPCGIERLQKLEEIYAKNCSLEGEIASDICELSCLRILVLSGNHISCLPISMSKLSRLEILLLEDCNKLRALPELPSSLTKLHVSSQSLKKIPDLSNLINLKVLHLSGGSLLRLPTPSLQWTGKLSKLETLHLSLSSITSFPDLGTLTQLKNLALTCANLQCNMRLPSSLLTLSVGGCKSLTVLSDLSNLKNLLKLTLNDSSINEIRGLACLKSLQDFEVNDCKISDVDGLEHLEDLRHLVLCGFKSIKRLPDLSKLKKLGKLKFHDCQNLKELKGLDKLDRLQELHISGCRSVERKLNLSNLNELKVLDIQDCEELPGIDGLEKLQSLEELKISGCGKIGGPLNLSNLGKLKVLQIRSCAKVTCIEGFQRLESLEVLGIVDCSGIEGVLDLSNFEKLTIQIEHCHRIEKIVFPKKLISLKLH